MNFFNHRAKNITVAAFILMVATLISKILGLIRIRIFTSLFSTSQLDVYFAAFRLPDLVYNILILGAISASFIPVFSSIFERSEKKAWKFCNQVLCIFSFFLVLLALFLIILAPFLMKFITPGFDKEKLKETILLTRIMFLSPIFLGLSSIFGALLQYFSRFLVYSLAPILYNLGIIFGALVFSPSFGVLGLSFGVVLGSFLHFLIQFIGSFFVGFSPRIYFSFSKAVKKVFILMGPRIAWIIANQLNLLFLTAIASTLIGGSIAIFSISNDIQYLPISLFGISFAVAAFPSLSQSISQKNKKEFLKKFKTVFSQILFATLPLSFLFFLLRAHLTRVIAGSQLFSWQDTRLTAACLGLFSLSIPAQSLIPLLSRAFYSLHDTKTPVKIGILCIILNISLSLIFVSILENRNSLFSQFLSLILKLEGLSNIKVLALPLALSCSFILNLIFLLFAFKRKVSFSLKPLFNSFLRIFILSGLSFFVCFIFLRIFSLILDLSTFWGIFFQGGLSGVLALVFYLFSAKKLNLSEYKEFTQSLKKKI